jgi:hypothetical protein
VDAATLKLVAQYGIGGIISLALVWLLGRILWKIGERMIAAIDELRKAHSEDAKAMREALDESNDRNRAAFEAMATRFDAHTKADVEALKSVQISVANLDGKFDAVLDKLDRTPPVGVPTVALDDPDPPAKPIASNIQRRTPGVGTPILPPPHHKRGRTNG